MRSFAALFVLLNACGGGSPAEVDPAPAALTQRAWMRAHFTEGVAIRDAVTRGQLDDARARLERMAGQPGPRDAPPTWEPHLTALRGAAQRGARATDLPEAAAAVGGLALVCGDCHAATSARVPLSALDAPDPQEAPEAMRRHQWAAERMWEGLVAPAPDRFRDGASVLAAAPMHPTELVVGGAPPLEVVGLAERARSLAGDASRADTAQERGRLYGELLSTCAACHGQQ